MISKDVIGRSCGGLLQNINTDSMSCGQNEYNLGLDAKSKKRVKGEVLAFWLPKSIPTTAGTDKLW